MKVIIILNNPYSVSTPNANFTCLGSFKQHRNDSTKTVHLYFHDLVRICREKFLGLNSCETVDDAPVDDAPVDDTSLDDALVDDAPVDDLSKPCV